MYPKSCKNQLTIKQHEVIDRKLCQMYDNFIAGQDARLEAKIESGEVPIEDLAAI